LVGKLERGLVPAREGLARIVRLELREAIGFAARVEAIDALRPVAERIRELQVQGVDARVERRVRAHGHLRRGPLRVRRRNEGPLWVRSVTRRRVSPSE